MFSGRVYISRSWYEGKQVWYASVVVKEFYEHGGPGTQAALCSMFCSTTVVLQDIL